MKKLIVLTGSGMSRESGIPSLRDSGSLWEKYPIDDVATPHGWRKNPALVLNFFNQRRIQSSSAKPNDGHLALAALEKKYDVHVITQNVDNLHERAGSTQVLHLHGELMKARSTGPGAEIFELPESDPKLQLGQKCPKGYQLRPHVVWFGEEIPKINKAIEIVQQADIFLILGTSLNTYPATTLIEHIKPLTPIYIIDPNKANTTSSREVIFIQEKVSKGIKILQEKYLKQKRSIYRKIRNLV